MFRVKMTTSDMRVWIAIALVMLLVNAMVYSLIGFGIYVFLQWLGGQL